VSRHCTTRSGPLLAALGAILAAGSAHAERISARVLDEDGLPVPEVAVIVRADTPRLVRASHAATATPATMNQSQQAFEPHLLVVETGTRIEFPNSDDVRHHVYSFSPAKRFDFSIAAGSIHEALEFSVPGVVSLGCNIHDDMLGYILVVDTPDFGITDRHGSVTIDGLAPGPHTVEIWTPRISSKRLPAPRTLELSPDNDAAVEFRFDRKLYPPHKHSATSLEWGDY
jgi:plastocyanin